jgi:hypothetical protein
MALVQMRTPQGSYSMVDEKLVRVYEAEGWVLTSELPEFKTKDVTYYDEARRTVTTTKGEEKPVEEVIDEPQMGFREERETSTTTLSERAQRSRDYTADEWQALVNAPLEDKLEIIKNNAANGMKLTPSQKYFLDKQYKVAAADINNAQDDGKAGKLETPESGPLKPGEAGYGVDTWYEFLGYRSEDDAMRDFVTGDLTAAEIRRAEAEIEPEPADIIVDLDKVQNSYGVADSDWARVTPSGKQYVSLLESIEALENSMFGSTPPGQAVIKDLKSGTSKDITVSGGGTGNPNLGSGTSSKAVETKGECPEGFRFDESIQACVPIDDGDDGDGQPDDDKTFTPNNLEAIELNNIPVGAEVWDVDGTLYLAYAVPGAGDLYTGSTIWMAYDVVGNDLFEAGLLTAGFEYKGPNGSPSKSWFDSTAVLAGNTNQLIGMDSDPFASFVETYKEEALLRPWLLDNEFIELQAEAALEDRDISEAEWRATTWYQTHSQAERDWMDIELSDPSEAQRQRDDLELYYKNQLQGLGVNNVPDGLIQWVTNKNITGTWSDLKTAEQLQLFADPYKTGERDIEMSNFIATSGFGDVDRTAAREKEVVELYRKWLGPSLGALTQEEVSSIAGRLRDDPDYEDALVNSLKQSRLAAFSNYTNPELTYEDIARPWRNLTTSVWGQNADETQGWWQEMVKSNDYSTAQTTLREKGLEQNINQVSVDASQALQNALGQGSISQTGVNV